VLLQSREGRDEERREEKRREEGRGEERTILHYPHFETLYGGLARLGSEIRQQMIMLMKRYNYSGLLYSNVSEKLKEPKTNSFDFFAQQQWTKFSFFLLIEKSVR
jgi:hypothetical protein